MNKLEAICLCMSGKKVRVKSWMSEVYVEYRGRTGFYIKNGGRDWNIFNWNVDQEDVWEEYFEIVDFYDALEHMRKGGIAVKQDINKQKYKIENNFLYVFYEGGKEWVVPTKNFNNYLEHKWVLL